MLVIMSMPVPSNESGPLAEFIERYEPLRILREWIAGRLGETPQVDDSIAWEDGEEHDEPEGPTTV